MLALHFTISLGIWSVAWAGSLREIREYPSWATQRFTWYFQRSLPCCGLFVLALLTLRATWTRSRRAVALLSLLVSISVLSFCYDVSHDRWEISVDIATTEYWESGGRAHFYATWWWYNDRLVQHWIRVLHPA